MSSRVLIPALAAALVLCAGATAAETCHAPGELDQKNIVSLHVIDVGQGDAMAVTCPDGSIGMIVDSGDKKEEAGFARMQEYLKKLETRSPAKKAVPLFVATHPDADHIGGGTWVLQTFSVKTFLDDGRPVGTKTYLNLRALAQRQAAESSLAYLHAGEARRSFEICPGVHAEIVTPAAVFSACENNNECSVVLRVTHGAVSFLLTGDAGKAQERALLHDDGAGKMLHATVLKVGHHGSQSSSSTPFIKAVRPGCAVISSGKPGEGSNARYNHPRQVVVNELLGVLTLDRRAPAVVEAYAKKGGFKKIATEKCLYHTAIDGTVVFLTDGKKLACESGR